LRPLADGRAIKALGVNLLDDSWTFSLLGRLEVVANGRVVPVHSRLIRRLLATLLFRGGEVVPAWELVDAVWEVPPRNAANSLHVLVKRLRAALGSVEWIAAVSGGYYFRFGEAKSDLMMFQAQVRRADAAATAHDRTAELAALTAALSLWPAADMGTQNLDFLPESAAADLKEQWLIAVSRRIALDLEEGRYDDALGPLRRLTRRHPLREELWEQLLTTLLETGRHGEGLAAYAQVRQAFADELGVEPGLRLQKVHAELLAADDTSSSPPGRQGSGVWNSLSELPPDTKDLVARESATAELLEILQPDEHVPVAVVWGQPGVGKSALATHVAHRLRKLYPDGHWYVPLTTTVGSPTEPAEILEWLLTASGMPQGLVPRSFGARAAALRARLADRRVLLVLDGVTHSRQVLPLLPGTAGCAVLVTSVGVLADLPGARHVRVEPLATGDGYDLLCRLLGENRVARERAAAEEVLGLCSGLPLAVRIAAARLAVRPDLDLRWLALRLQDEQSRLDALTTGTLQLRSSLRVAYEALEPLARTALQHAGWLPRSGFAAWAVGALVDGSDGELLVDNLMTAGLLDSAGVDAAGQRYRCHDMVSIYAREISVADAGAYADEERKSAAARRLLDTALEAAETVYHHLAGSVEDLRPQGVPARSARIDDFPTDPTKWVWTERAVLLATIDLACGTKLYADAARLADLVVPALCEHGDLDQLRTRRTAIRDAAFAAGDELIGWRAEYGRSDAMLADDLREAEATLRGCVAAFARLGSTEEMISSIASLAYAKAKQGTPDLELMLRGCALADDQPDPATRLVAGRSSVHTLLALGRAEESLVVAQGLLVDVEGIGKPFLTVPILLDATHAALGAHELELAAVLCRQASMLTPDNNQGHGWILQLWSRIHAARGEGSEAVACAAESLEIMIQLGNRRGAASALFRLGQAYLVTGDQGNAVPLLRRACPMLQATGDLPLERAAQSLLADLEMSEAAVVPRIFP
jgi:DNA-binding SARP family transcriptional activator